jgi:hypothetical protein
MYQISKNFIVEVVCGPNPITDNKKHRDEGAALFAVRVDGIVRHYASLDIKDLISLSINFGRVIALRTEKYFYELITTNCAYNP